MLKSLLRYLFLTCGIATVGVILGISSSLNNNASEISAGNTIGMIMFFLSPLISGAWLWFIRRRSAYKQNKKNEAEKRKILVLERQRLAESIDKHRKEFLKMRVLERQSLIDSIDKHRSTLARNIERAVTKNDYGAVVSDKRTEAFEEFFASISLDMNLLKFHEAVEIACEQLEIKQSEDRESGFDSSSLPLDGHAFERWVADGLNGFGWTANVTSASRDQGIDVIAEKHGKRVGIQCKLYSNAIGNKAVQEAHAGKSYYQTDAVAVLSNAPFTSSARDLAQATKVHLLSHHDIPKLYETVFENQ